MHKLIVGTISAVLLLSAPTFGQAGDAAKGERAFKKCALCHEIATTKNKIGPHLNGIVGRKAASVEEFKYSPAMKKAGEEGLVWDEETLDTYLKKPRALVKGTSMAFAGVKKDTQRADLIAYIKTIPAAQ